jgi:ABC-type transport system substrate-binding protein
MPTLLLTIILIIGSIPLALSQPTPQRGPAIDVLRLKVVKSLDAQVSQMMGCELDVVADLMRHKDIETLDGAGMTITSALGFHMGHIAFNIRSDQSYRHRPDHALVAKVLSDVWFRLALFKCFNQYEAVLSIWERYIVTPIHSLVPPAQASWHNPSVPKIWYDPGNKFATTQWPEDDSACGVLRYAGYTYDSSINNWRTPEAWETELGGKPIPELRCLWPIMAGYPFTPRYLADWIADCRAIGLTRIEEWGASFGWFLEKVFGEADFDMYIMFWNLDRFPDHIYDMCHSSQDCALHPWRYNVPGIHDPLLDCLVETVKYSLNYTEKMIACHKAQEMLYDENYPKCAFVYMQLYSRTDYNAYKAGLMGAVNSLGYGSDNSWTYLNINWEPGHENERIEGGDSVMIYQLGYEPELLNSCFAHTSYAWAIMNRLFDSLIEVNPYTHEDMLWMVESWTIEEFTGTITLDSENRYLSVPAGGTVDIVDGMKMTFNLRDDVEWHDGNIYTASDAEFNLEFLRNNEIPRYAPMWMPIVDVQAISSTAFTVYSDVTSQWLICDIADAAALLPPPVWSWLDGKSLSTILGYNPATNTTKPTGAGPRFGTDTCPTQLYGTGPFVFVHYYPGAMYTDMPANRYYFKETTEIHDQIVEMFYYAGDVDRDGEVWGVDKARYSQSYGYSLGEPEYDADCDISGPEGVPDGTVDAWDGILIAIFWGDKREYP